jgi:hypothetical protein
MLGKRIQSLVTTIVLTGGMAAAVAVILPTRAQAQDPTQNSSDSVADAARKSRENKKNAPKGTKVYTDDEVSPTPAPGANAQAATPPTDGSAPASGDQAAPANGTAGASDPKNPQGGAGTTDKADEKAWRKRFQEQRDKIAFAEKELDVLQREQDKAQVQYYPDPQKALSEGYTRKDINEKDVKIAAKKDEIAKLKQGLDDMEDELRKSGGDPGWAR